MGRFRASCPPGLSVQSDGVRPESAGFLHAVCAYHEGISVRVNGVRVDGKIDGKRIELYGNIG